MAHPELGEKVLREFTAQLGDVKIDQEPKLQGRSMNMSLYVGKPGKVKENEK